MKRCKLILFLLVASISAIAVYRRAVSTCPPPMRPSQPHTFDSDGWYAPAVALRENEKGEMVEIWWDAHYIYSSNTVTGVETKERYK